jgi:DNA-binding MarR family transcriptional regulator
MAVRRTVVAPVLSDEEMDAWHGFLHTHAALVRQLDVEMQAAHGLSLTQYEVLLLLARTEGGSRRMSDLAEGALLSLSGLSRLVDRLVAMGLVERAQCPNDRRSSLACLTDAGRVRFAEAQPTHHEGVRRLFIDRLPDDSVQALNAAWAALGEGGGCS